MLRSGSRRLQLLLCLVLAACPGPDPGDPVASLAEPAPSGRYDLAFWAEQQHHGTRAWQEAQAFCRNRQERDHPNCTSIRLVGWLETPPSLPALHRPAYPFNDASGLATATPAPFEESR